MNEELVPKLLSAAQKHELSAVQKTGSVGAAEIKKHLGALMAAMVASELEKKTMLEVPIRSRDERRIKDEVLPTLREHIQAWKDHVRAQFGDDGMSFMAALAQDCDFYFRGAVAREGKERYKLGEARATTLEDLAVEEAVDAGAMDLEWSEGHILHVRAESRFQEVDVLDGLERLLASPEASQLVSLTLGLWSEAGSSNDYGEVLDVLAAGGPYECLSKLNIGDYRFPDDMELSWTSVGDIGRLWPLMPELQHLRVQGANVGLGRVAAPNLHTLEIISTEISRSTVESIVEMEAPALHTLEVWLGVHDHKDFAPFLERRLSALTHLKLKNTRFTAQIVEGLQRCPFLSQLVTLDLSLGCLGGESTEDLVILHGLAPKLKRLNVDANYLPRESIQRLRGVYGKALYVGEQRSEDSDDDERYVGISE